MREREYKECYIAFLDLLGFKALIETGDMSCEKIAKLFDEIGRDFKVKIDNENCDIMDLDN